MTQDTVEEEDKDGDSGSPHLMTALINEHPTLGQNNVRLLANPSIGLLRFDKEVLPYKKLTAHYDNLLGNPLRVADDIEDMLRPKRDRSASHRFEPT